LELVLAILMLLDERLFVGASFRVVGIVVVMTSDLSMQFRLS